MAERDRIERAGIDADADGHVLSPFGRERLYPGVRRGTDPVNDFAR
jgi:hypothetical protein